MRVRGGIMPRLSAVGIPGLQAGEDVKYDTCRCHDDGCPERTWCGRWIHRDTKDPRAVHSWSLRAITYDGFPDYVAPCLYPLVENKTQVQ
jgi:hypothetical protein